MKPSSVSRTGASARGVLFVDALVAAAVLAITAVAIAAAASAGNNARLRAAAMDAASDCFEEALAAFAADRGATSGVCAGSPWRIIPGDDGILRWEMNGFSAPMPQRAT